MYLWPFIYTAKIFPTELSVGWWVVWEPRLPNPDPDLLGLLLMIRGIYGVCEGAGYNGTIRWVAVAVFVWIILRCTAEVRFVDIVAYPLSSKTCQLGRVYSLIQPAALLSSRISVCWFQDNHWYLPLWYILASGI